MDAHKLPASTTHVVVGVGSLGDVLPLLHIAHGLQRRGKQVVFLSAQRFGTLAADFGVPFVSILAEDQTAAILDDPELWHPHRGIRVLWPGILRGAQMTVELLEDFARQSDRPLTMVGGTMAIGLRIAHERWGWPHVGIQVSPCWTFSSNQPPKLAGLQWLHRLPQRWRGKVWAWVDKNMLDPVFLPGLNAWRAQLGLPPVRRMLGKWSASPQRVVGLYPPWFAPLQPDAPKQLALADFLMPAIDASPELPAQLDAFLNKPGDTVLFMAGSGMQHANAFFNNAAQATQQLGLKALLVMPQPSSSHTWGDHVMTQAHVALARVLPRCKALVSHAGIGSIAHGLAAGVPMLLVSYAFDHFDNAYRACQLGVARPLQRDASAAALAHALQALLSDPSIARACADVQQRMQPGDEVLQWVCDQIPQ
jgi:UDP:flavonoid glycosyltransferase YjiC (YdhE family)